MWSPKKVPRLIKWQSQQKSASASIQVCLLQSRTAVGVNRGVPQGGVYRYVPAVAIWAARNVRNRAGLLLLSVSTSHCHFHSYKYLSCRNTHRLLTPFCSPPVPVSLGVSSFSRVLSLWDRMILYTNTLLGPGNKLEMTSKSTVALMHLHLNWTKLRRQTHLNEMGTSFFFWCDEKKLFCLRPTMNEKCKVQHYFTCISSLTLHIVIGRAVFPTFCSLIFSILLSLYPLSPLFHHSLSGSHLSACQSTLQTRISRERTCSAITP